MSHITPCTCIVYQSSAFNNFSSKRTIYSIKDPLHLELHHTTYCKIFSDLCTIQIYKDIYVSIFIRCQGDFLFPSLPSHRHLHRCPGHVACGWRGPYQTHLHLPGDLAETCTCKGNENKSSYFIWFMILHINIRCFSFITAQSVHMSFVK